MKKTQINMRKYAIFYIIINLVIYLVGNASSASASCNDTLCAGGFHTFKDYYLKTSDGKIHGKRYVYVSTKFKNNSSKGLISTGYTAWNISGSNEIRLAGTSNYDDCQIYIVPDTLDAGVNGITYFRKKSGESLINNTDNLSSNYIYARIEIDENRCQTQNILQKVVTHECGHALGLSHVTCRNSIMYPYSDSSKMLDYPSNLDKGAMCHIYNAIYK